MRQIDSQGDMQKNGFEKQGDLTNVDFLIDEVRAFLKDFTTIDSHKAAFATIYEELSGAFKEVYKFLVRVK